MKWSAIHMEATNTLELRVYDVIGEGWFGGVGAKSIARALDNHPDVSTILLRISSPGGDVFEAEAIASQLERHSARVEADIDGLAASAAVRLVMAADHVRMSPGAMMMIHNASSFTAGDAPEHEKTADLLRKISNTIGDIYAERTGLDRDTITEMMDAETWMNAQESLDNGFINEIVGVEDQAPAVSNAWNWSIFNYKRVPERLQRNPSNGVQMALKHTPVAADPVDVNAIAETAVKRALEANALAEQKAAAKEQERKFLIDVARSHGVEFANKLRNDADGDMSEMQLQLEMHVAAQPDHSGEHRTVSTPARDSSHNYHQAFADFTVIALSRGLPQNGAWSKVSEPYRLEAQKRGLNQHTPAFALLAPIAQSMGIDITRAHHSEADREDIIRQMRGKRLTNGVTTKDGARYVMLGSGLVPADLESVYLDVPRKSLDAGHSRVSLPLARMAREVNLPDFREVTFVKMDLAADWKKISEDGELNPFTAIDSKYVLKADRYGGLYVISDLAIANDDLGGLVRIPAMIGQYIGSEESDIARTAIQAGLNGSGFDANHGLQVTDPLDFDSFLDDLRKRSLQQKVVEDTKGMLKPGQKLSTSEDLEPDTMMYGPGARKAWIVYSAPLSASQGAGLSERGDVVRGEFERQLFANSIESKQMDVNDTRSYYWPTGMNNPLLWGRVSGRGRRIDTGEAPMTRVPGQVIRVISTFAFGVRQNYLYEVSQAPPP